jgi:hypothetical protein
MILCDEHVDNLEAYSIPSETASSQSYLFVRSRQGSGISSPSPKSADATVRAHRMCLNAHIQIPLVTAFRPGLLVTFYL